MYKSLPLVPVIKGAVYINTHSNYSQPDLTKLYNENIGGHRYTFTVYQILILCKLYNAYAYRRPTRVIGQHELTGCCRERFKTRLDRFWLNQDIILIFVLKFTKPDWKPK